MQSERDSVVGSSARGGALGRDLDVDAWFERLKRATAGEDAALGRLGQYELLGVAGRGGQGLVYRARQQRPSRDVALKRPAAGIFATRETRARFEREIEAVAALDHASIVKVYGVEEFD